MKLAFTIESHDDVTDHYVISGRSRCRGLTAFYGPQKVQHVGASFSSPVAVAVAVASAATASVIVAVLPCDLLAASLPVCVFGRN
ncbi:hypothetical protein KIN20_028918 [Parelaphostrongylus tenuis]|uniref:Uncharacterized protein n=1 Tax=Parelaphostrongylus tenuis TaxID=148309 RepID=A0AAD5WF66_PARTN|nr:hypothetical protein KIN20_028918 [Parelaphostrongylus tenuis]